MADITGAIVLVLFGVGLAVWFYLTQGDFSKAEKDRLLDPDSEPMLWEPPDREDKS